MSTATLSKSIKIGVIVDTKAAEKGMAALARLGKGKSGIAEIKKDFEAASKLAKEFGAEGAKAAKILGAAFNNPQKEVDKLTTRMNVLFNIINNGADKSVDKIARMQKALREAGEERDEWNKKVATGGGNFSGSKMLGGVGAVIGGIGIAAGMYGQSISQNTVSRTSVNEFLKSKAMNAYRARWTDALLQKKYGSVQKAQDYANDQGKWSNIKEVGIAGGQTVGGAALMYGGALLSATGVGAIAGVPMMAAGAALTVRGVYNANTEMTPEAITRRKMEFQEEKMGEERSRHLDPELMDFLQQRAPARYAFQRNMGMGTRKMTDNILYGALNGLGESDVLNMGLSMRSVVGSRQASGLMPVASEFAKMSGYGGSASASLAANAQLVGNKSSAEELGVVFAKALADKFDDTGLIQDLQEGIVGGLKNAGIFNANVTGVQSQALSGLYAYNNTDMIGKRQIDAAVGAENIVSRLKSEPGAVGFGARIHGAIGISKSGSRGNEASYLNDMYAADPNNFVKDILNPEGPYKNFANIEKLKKEFGQEKYSERGELRRTLKMFSRGSSAINQMDKYAALASKETDPVKKAELIKKGQVAAQEAGGLLSYNTLESQNIGAKLLPDVLAPSMGKSGKTGALMSPSSVLNNTPAGILVKGGAVGEAREGEEAAKIKGRDIKGSISMTEKGGAAAYMGIGTAANKLIQSLNDFTQALSPQGGGGSDSGHSSNGVGGTQGDYNGQ